MPYGRVNLLEALYFYNSKFPLGCNFHIIRIYLVSYYHFKVKACFCFRVKELRGGGGGGGGGVVGGPSSVSVPQLPSGKEKDVHNSDNSDLKFLHRSKVSTVIGKLSSDDSLRWFCG